MESPLIDGPESPTAALFSDAGEIGECQAPYGAMVATVLPALAMNDVGERPSGAARR
jgi:hypothetical protein